MFAWLCELVWMTQQQQPARRWITMRCNSKRGKQGFPNWCFQSLRVHAGGRLCVYVSFIEGIKLRLRLHSWCVGDYIQAHKHKTVSAATNPCRSRGGSNKSGKGQSWRAVNEKNKTKQNAILFNKLGRNGQTELLLQAQVLLLCSYEKEISS